MAAPRWLRRAALLTPAAGCLLLAVVLAGAASSTATLTCDRAAGRCTWSTSTRHGRGDHGFAVADVREVRFIDRLGKHGREAETALVFASGHERHLGRGDADAARVRFRTVEAFFAGHGPALRVHSAGNRWLYAAALAAAIGAVVLAIRGARRRLLDTMPVPGAPPRVPFLARREVRFFLGVLAVAAVGQIVLLIVASTTQGTLVLECRTRCRFQAGECLPGGSLRTTLDPGEHTIDVWAATGDAVWQPRTFTIAVGEVTTFVCK
jgi:hypothetical protein